MSETVINAAPMGGEQESFAPSETALRFKAHMEAEGLTLAQAAQMSSIPKGTLGLWLHGKYTGRNDNIDEKAQKWLESLRTRSQVRKLMPREPSFLETPSAIIFRSVFEYAQTGPDIGLITGNAGVGKTMSAEAYRKETPNVWMMTADSSMRSPTAVLRELTEIVDAAEKRGPRMMASLIRRVQGSHGLIIVDEAQHLQTESIDLLRTINDRAQIGLVFMGNEPLKGRIEGMSRDTSHAQIFSRIGMRKNRKQPQAKDTRAIFDAWGIEDTGLFQICRWIAGQPGGLRSMNKTLRYASMIAASDERNQITERDIQSAWSSLTNGELPSYAGRE
ncbi:AAA family ATPase [Gluconobacter sp. LMG 31484]|uniref:AAA family ATPase n=1 Tax=Gluconobacter vitians TaxID=2728102 RepID=A0ABR9Y4F9_9PROT|nr:AAA family ATPase [Gluconobacter vitians]MBF0858827.1 AAA family ATPase [Gluconobacter vitians]